MALFGLYIDPAGTAHLVADPPANPPLPIGFVNELKKHKTCPFVLGNDFKGLNNAAIEKKITDGISEWEADERKNRAAINKAEKDNDPTAAIKAAKGQETKDLEAEDTANKNNLKGINNNPNLSPADKRTKTDEENTRHIKARGAIIAKRAADEKAATDKQKAAVDVAKAAAIKPKPLDIGCNKTDACPQGCKLTQMGVIEYEEKKVKKESYNTGTLTEPNYSQLAPNHMYFCICG
jgi:hypothetical protein